MFESLSEIEYNCRTCDADITTEVFTVLEKEEAVKAKFDCSECGDTFESYMPASYFEDD